MINALKQYISRIPGVLLCTRLFFSPRQELRQWLAYFQFRRVVAPFRSSLFTNRKKKGRLLVVDLLGQWVEAVKQEAFFVKAAELYGLTPVIVTNRAVWANCYYRAFGVKRFVYLEDYLFSALRRVDQNTLDSIMKQVNTFSDLMQYQYQGVKSGKYVSSTLLRRTRGGGIHLGDTGVRALIRSALHQSIVTVHAAQKIYNAYQPAATLFLERGYSPYGEFFDISMQRGLNTVQWCSAHRDNTFILKRYHRGNTDVHPASLSQATWGFLTALPWSTYYADRVKRELAQNYTSGNWYSEVGTQFHTQLKSKKQIQKILGLDSSRKTAVIFSHLFWDATFFWGKDLFKDYQEWFIESVRAACANPKINWILKLHPANVVKQKRDQYKGELVELQTIRDHIGKLPSHVKILMPETDISTYSLFDLMDYCVTVRGTIGIEASVFGIPTFTAGTGRYDAHGFTIDSPSREEYLGRLARIQEYPRLDALQIELAQKFAYGTFILRPFGLKSIQSIYRRDEKATLEVRYLFGLPDELLRAKDINDFGQWFLHSRDEDYCNEL